MCYNACNCGQEFFYMSKFLVPALLLCLGGCAMFGRGEAPEPTAKKDAEQVIEIGRDGTVHGLPQRQNLHGLSLSQPKVKGKKVVVSGDVEVPVQSIAWSWGDETFDEHQWMPAKHKYAKPGVYQIKALTRDAGGGMSLATVSVQIK
jgi:hypothetical protein